MSSLLRWWWWWWLLSQFCQVVNCPHIPTKYIFPSAGNCPYTKKLNFRSYYPSCPKCVEPLECPPCPVCLSCVVYLDCANCTSCANCLNYQYGHNARLDDLEAVRPSMASIVALSADQAAWTNYGPIRGSLPGYSITSIRPVAILSVVLKTPGMRTNFRARIGRLPIAG